MAFFLAGILAAIISWIANTYLVRYRGDAAVLFYIPPLEETVKTGSAVLFSTSIPLVHLVFGLIEAVHDYLASSRWGVFAGVLSILGHGLFGLITYVIYFFTYSWIFSILTASIIHIIWNIVMVRLFSFHSIRKK